MFVKSRYPRSRYTPLMLDIDLEKKYSASLLNMKEDFKEHFRRTCFGLFVIRKTDLYWFPVVVRSPQPTSSNYTTIIPNKC